MSKQGGWWLNYLPPWRLDNLSEKGAENFRHNGGLNYLLEPVNYILYEGNIKSTSASQI